MMDYFHSLFCSLKTKISGIVTYHMIFLIYFYGLLLIFVFIFIFLFHAVFIFIVIFISCFKVFSNSINYSCYYQNCCYIYYCFDWIKINYFLFYLIILSYYFESEMHYAVFSCPAFVYLQIITFVTFFGQRMDAWQVSFVFCSYYHYCCCNCTLDY